jgi:predicted O-methyltransferase YrrM
VLEIGTGTGVGLAWMTSGLGGREDVEVVSIEADPELSEAARSIGWSSNVEVVTADALAVLGDFGSFDLVFADAAPVKYGNIDAILGALRPGGFLVIDDLVSTARTAPQHVADKDSLRRTLMRKPDVQVVEFSEPNGVMVVARAR